MQIGNWRITEKSLEWTGKNMLRFAIEKEMLLETTSPPEAYGGQLYKWIVLATDTDWLTADDLYDLNFAFVYAAGYWRMELDYTTFDDTAAYQFDELDDEEDEQP
jgi:hypothetical protein